MPQTCSQLNYNLKLNKFSQDAVLHVRRQDKHRPTFAKITGVTFKSILRKTTIDLNSYICTNNLMLLKLLSFLIVYAHYYYYDILILHVVQSITLSGFSRSEYHT